MYKDQVEATTAVPVTGAIWMLETFFPSSSFGTDVNKYSVWMLEIMLLPSHKAIEDMMVNIHCWHHIVPLVDALNKWVKLCIASIVTQT